MINDGLSLERYSFEADEWHVAFRARSGDTAGVVEVYLHPEDLLEWADQLLAFGASVKDEARLEFGSPDPKWAYHLVVRAFILNNSGHAAVEFVSGNHFDPPAGARTQLYVPCEVAAVNRLGRHVRTWVKETANLMVWTPAP